MKEEEIVCGCFNVKKSDIRKAISDGADTFQKVVEVTKVTTGCGGCVEAVKQLVNEMLREANEK